MLTGFAVAGIPTLDLEALRELAGVMQIKETDTTISVGQNRRENKHFPRQECCGGDRGFHKGTS